MNSVLSKLENNPIDQLYRKNRTKSISFLIILSAALLLTILLSLRSGSYDTPIVELVKGLFGMSADRKINLVVQNNRLPRILTAILAGGGLGLAGCILQAVLRNPLASASNISSYTAMVLASAVSLMRVIISFDIGGMMRFMTWSRMILKKTCFFVSPSTCPASY